MPLPLIAVGLGLIAILVLSLYLIAQFNELLSNPFAVVILVGVVIVLVSLQMPKIVKQVKDLIQSIREVF